LIHHIKTPFFFAIKYVFLKKNNRAINILSLITMLSMAIGSMAMIIVMSVFNGFETLAINLYESFEPQLTISPIKGKVVQVDEFLINKIKATEGVENVSLILESKAYLKYRDKETIAILKGVEPSYFKTNKISEFLIVGDTLLEDANNSYAMLGLNIAEKLQVKVDDPFESLAVYVPKSSQQVGIAGDMPFEHSYISPRSVFSVYQEYDEKYIVVPISFVQYLMGHSDFSISSIELSINQDEEIVKDRLLNTLKNSWKIKNRLEKNETLYKLTKVEKMITYLVMGFILFILSLNFIGSLTMHFLEKQKDLKVLLYLGINRLQIQRIYLLIGFLQSFIGGLFGLFLGLLVLMIQYFFEIIKMPGSGTFVISAYPVEIRILDIILILGLVVLISFLMALWPAYRAKNV
jgi:lipoprotein-releasing system permease protein